MAAQVPDDVLRLFAAIGTYEDLPARIAERFGGLVDSVAIDAGEGADPAVVRRLVQAVRAIPGRFEGFATSWDRMAA
jgi:hypothetical protein